MQSDLFSLFLGLYSALCFFLLLFKKSNEVLDICSYFLLYFFSAPESFICREPVSFCWWLLSQLAPLYYYNETGTFCQRKRVSLCFHVSILHSHLVVVAVRYKEQKLTFAFNTLDLHIFNFNSFVIPLKDVIYPLIHQVITPLIHTSSQSLTYSSSHSLRK